MFNYNNAIDANFKIQIVGKNGLDFYAKSINIPTVSLGAIEVPFRDTRAKVPDNRYIWDDLTISFMLDEELYSYELLKNWIHDVREKDKWMSGIKDIHIIPQDSNKNIEYSFLMQGSWPNMIGGWQYSSMNQASTFISFDVTFSYQHLEIKRLKPLSFSIVD